MTGARLVQQLSRRPMLCDGGMGTQLMARGLASGVCPERWNVDRPNDVMAIHRAYLDAGCDLITTNTFGGTRASLARHGLGGRVAELNRAGAAAARAAVGGRPAFVLGDVGPFGGFLEPVGDTMPEELSAMFREQIEALREGGVDAIIIETMADPSELTLAIRAARDVGGDWPVIATFAFGHGDAGSFRTMMGTPVEQAMATAIEAGADVVGANCGTNLSLPDYVRLAGELVKSSRGEPVILQPNAGAPQMIEGRLSYDAGTREMAGAVGPLLDAGVRMIGGCCGTTPEHLRAMGQILRVRTR